MAGRTPGQDTAVLASDAERRQDFHHARGDGAAVRASSRALRKQRPAIARIRLAQPKQQDSRHHRSARARREAVAVVGVGGDSALSGRQVAIADSRGCAGPLRNHSMVDVSSGWSGPHVRSGRFNKFAGKEYEDKRPRDRYVAEAKRLLGVLDRRLSERSWIMGDAYTIADIAIFPWINVLNTFYEAGDLTGLARYEHVMC